MAAAFDTLEKARTVVIATHIDPDGDAVGSALGLAGLLSKRGKEVAVYDRDPVPYNYKFLPGAETVSDRLPESCDLLCLLDCSSRERAGEKLAAWRGAAKSLCIDHHLTAATEADINLIYPEASATGELIYELALALDPDFGADVAVNLYTAILTDTGSFRYSNASPAAFAAAGDLVRRGVNPWDVTQQVYESHPLARIKLLALVLETLEISPSGQAASVTVTREMFAATGSNSEFTDGMINYPRSIAGVEVAFMVRETGDNEYKISFRSRGRVNVAELAAEYGGGGHHNAAGCRMRGTLAEINRRVFSLIEERLGSAS
ncbi:MAG: bifunctional oligoribonuclease/PAP phosphatase NrnA [Deltaproteobacteria bacterium]|nr:bifunctional oligoribonuclease/PAP phosphatase NrnA [Deltaproteobacteria bacterium]